MLFADHIMRINEIRDEVIHKLEHWWIVLELGSTHGTWTQQDTGMVA